MHVADKHVDLQSAKLLDYAPYQVVYDTVTKNQAEKGKRPDGNHDPLDNTGKETFMNVQIQQLSRHLMSLNQTDADLHHALDVWLLNVIGRSDDGRPA
jgi:hypothetical protein